MLSIGKMNNLIVDCIVDMGVHLESDQGSVFLPEKDMLEKAQPGDTLNVFVYYDSKRRLKATTSKPYAVVDDITTLEVVDVNDFGAFLDWGMEKDLLLPYRHQRKRVFPGQKCVVKLLLDENSGRVTASTRLRPFLELNDGSLSAGDEISVVFFDESEMGFSAVVNDTYLALLYRQDATMPINIGESRIAYIKRVLPEGHIELSLRKVGHKAVVEARTEIITALKNARGFLPYTDKSSPEEIRNYFDMSKKSFKKVIGTLYKEKKIKLEDKGIRLL